MLKTIQIKVNVNGRVQGVYYRAETKKAADKLGVTGYVKNLPDGSVEAVFKGNAPLVEKMIEWCHNGSENAKVDQVSKKNIDSLEDFSAFEVRY